MQQVNVCRCAFWVRAIGLLMTIAIGRDMGFAQSLLVTPNPITLHGNFEQVQVLVATGSQSNSERWDDQTSTAEYSSLDTAIARVDTRGRVTAVGNGQTNLQVKVGDAVQSIAVQVEGITNNPVIDFDNQVLPVLFKHGCNSGACHASQHGKGGFMLSVMGFDPIADHFAIARQARGRRVSPTAPYQSLILRKPLLDVPHTGGKRLESDSNDHHLLAAWIGSGMPEPKPEPRRVARLIATPASRVGAVGHKQQLRVVAEYADGEFRDVTAWTRFNSLAEAVAKVDEEGLVTFVGSGQSPIMARFAGEATLATMVVPFATDPKPGDWKSQNWIDDLALAKFQELGITSSGRCDDATFLRRAFLDAIGSLPTVDQARQFLNSSHPEKRSQLIDQLLGLTGDPQQDLFNDQYAAYWSLKWADLIRNNSAVTGESGMWALHNWLKEGFRNNKPFDAFVRELITAKGSVFSNGPANYYRIANNPSDLAESTSQLFLGTRLQCAKCHHHPYEKYGQNDYYGFAAFFARVGNKSSAEFGNFGGETVVMVTSGGEVTHPRTGQVMKPTPLDDTAIDDPVDRRLPLARWLTSPNNRRFADNVVNRYMAYLLGRGLVEPIDDLRSTNPPTNVALMQGLSDAFVKSGFDIKQLMRLIMNSRLYQLDSNPSENNAADDRFYSHFRVKRIAAEPLLDCIDFATGSPTKHPNLPLGTRAVELPDANTTNPFLMTFGKPKRATVCECERTPDENLGQALHMLNGDIVATKIADSKGRIASLVAANHSPDSIIEELFLATLSRLPSHDEKQVAQQAISLSPNPTEGYQDLLWALINSKQFLFVR